MAAEFDAWYAHLTVGGLQLPGQAEELDNFLLRPGDSQAVVAVHVRSAINDERIEIKLLPPC